MHFVNPILACDGYKVGHPFQYPAGTEVVYSNFTARSNKHAPEVFGKKLNKVTFFGLQGFILSFLIQDFQKGFFERPLEEVLTLYKRRMDTYLGPDSVKMDHIAALHKLGYLPIEIRAVKEGSRVDLKVPMLTIKNTEKEFFWVTNFLETALSAWLWKSINTATIASGYRAVLDHYARETGAPLDFVNWQGHDFSMRGVGGLQDAAINGAGHLVYFWGTDTIPALEFLEVFYAGLDSPVLGGSVPATEHSVMCAGGKEDERETFRRIIQDVYPSGVVSVVSDTWDFWNVLTDIAPSLKDVILNREPNALGLAKVVFRPDSGDPAEILCGTEVIDAEDIDEAIDILIDAVAEETDHGELGDDRPWAYFRINGEVRRVEIEIEWSRYDKRFYYMDGHRLVSDEPVTLTAEEKGAVEVLWDTFGGTVNEKGFKMLNERVGLIYGDSITLEKAQEILQRLADKGFASSNVVFGIGSYTYQFNTRDTFGMAMKATWVQQDGVGVEIFKDPKTDSGMKKSLKGLIRVEKLDNGDFVAYDQQTLDQAEDGALEIVFKDGVLYRWQTIEEIRKIALGG